MVFLSLKMNVFKLSGFFFSLRHYQVQSSPLSSEKIHSKQCSAGEMCKEPPSLHIKLSPAPTQGKLMMGFCPKAYLVVYQIQELRGDSRLEETFQKSINIEILII